MEIELKRNERRGKVYVSQVENILDGNTVTAYLPVSYGHVVNLPAEAEYVFLFFTEAGLLRFEGRIIGKFEEDGLSFMEIRLSLGGEKIQRRNYYRFPCLLPMKFTLVEEGHILTEYTEDEANEKMHNAIAKDLGGGGIRFIANADISEKNYLKCIIKLDDDYLIILGKVLQKYYFPKSNYRYQYRAGFVGILPEQRENIIRFIFKEQKKMLQKMNEL